MSLDPKKSYLTKISNSTGILHVGTHLTCPDICTVHKSKNKMSSNKLSFIIGGSMVIDIDEYLLTGSLSRKFIFNVRPLL